MAYGLWGMGGSPFLLHTIAGIPKSYGFSGVMGLEVYGLGGVQLYTIDNCRERVRSKLIEFPLVNILSIRIDSASGRDGSSYQNDLFELIASTLRLEFTVTVIQAQGLHPLERIISIISVN